MNNDIILDELYSSKGNYITSDKICRQLGISRIAVWNRINNLKKMGYKINAKRSVGYKLVEDGKDILIPYEIKRRIKTEFLGHNIEYFKLTSSTMDETNISIENNCPNGTLIIADQQTNGRGRKSRRWISSSRDNIYGSLIYFPIIMNPNDVILLMFSSSIAIIEALSDVGIDNARIKWPNDIVVDGKKIAGVIVETKAESYTLKSVVIGFGINVNMQNIPDEIKDIATSAFAQLQKNIDRVFLLVNMLFYLENLIKLIEDSKKSNILNIFREYDIVIGNNVEIHSDGIIIKGKAKDIDENGFLLVDCKSGLKRVTTSDSLRIV